MSTHLTPLFPARSRGELFTQISADSGTTLGLGRDTIVVKETESPEVVGQTCPADYVSEGLERRGGTGGGAGVEGVPGLKAIYCHRVLWFPGCVLPRLTLKGERRRAETGGKLSGPRDGRSILDRYGVPSRVCDPLLPPPPPTDPTPSHDGPVSDRAEGPEPPFDAPSALGSERRRLASEETRSRN